MATRVTERRTGGGSLLLTAEEVGALLGIHRDVVHRWDAAGRLPPPVLRRRGCTRWRRADLDDWIAAGCPDRRPGRR